MIQEDVENKTVNIAVTTGKLVVGHLIRGLDAWRAEQKGKHLQNSRSTEVKHGKQSVKELISQGQGVSIMTVGDEDIKAFKRICNKYGVDFAIVKEKVDDKVQYTVFFKGKDGEAIDKIIKDYTAKKMLKKDKPSVREKLKKFKEMVASTPRKQKEKRKDLEL